MKKFLLLLLILSATTTAYAKSYSIYVVDINGIVTATTADVVKKTLSEINNDNDSESILLIKLNTPGGTLDATRDIVQALLSTQIKNVVYVSPDGARAASAGAFILLASEFAIMNEATNVGASHPISSDGKDIDGKLGEKVENDTVALMRLIAEKRSRNIDNATDMVTKSVSYTAKEALSKNIINAISDKEHSYISLIKEHFNISGDVKIIEVEYTTIEKIKNILSNPNVLVALLFIGMLMIGLEFKIPGTFVFLGIGLASLTLFAVGSNIIPINFLGLILIISGIIMLVLEIFVISFGILTVGGIVAMVGGMLILFDGNQSSGIEVSYILIAVIVLSFLLITGVIGRLIIKDFKRKKVNGIDALIDSEATIIKASKGSGKAYIHGEIWDITYDDTEILLRDDVVKVVSRKDMVLRVKKVK